MDTHAVGAAVGGVGVAVVAVGVGGALNVHTAHADHARVGGGRIAVVAEGVVGGVDTPRGGIAGVGGARNAVVAGGGRGALRRSAIQLPAWCLHALPTSATVDVGGTFGTSPVIVDVDADGALTAKAAKRHATTVPVPLRLQRHPRRNERRALSVGGATGNLARTVYTELSRHTTIRVGRAAPADCGVRAARDWIAAVGGAEVVVDAVERGAGLAPRGGVAGLGAVAHVAVVADAVVGRVHTARDGIAGVGGAGDVVVANRRCTCHTTEVAAGLHAVAHVAVVAVCVGRAAPGGADGRCELADVSDCADDAGVAGAGDVVAARLTGVAFACHSASHVIDLAVAVVVLAVAQLRRTGVGGRVAVVAVTEGQAPGD